MMYHVHVCVPQTPPQSPAEELGLSQSGVEIVQINAQNVVSLRNAIPKSIN